MSTINDEAIRSLYVDHGRSVDEIAAQMGFKPVYVRVRLVIMGLIPKRRDEAPSDRPSGWLITEAAHAAAFAGQRFDGRVSA